MAKRPLQELKDELKDRKKLLMDLGDFERAQLRVDKLVKLEAQLAKPGLPGAARAFVTNKIAQVESRAQRMVERNEEDN